MIRVMLVLAMLAATAGAVVAYGDPDQIARASNSVTKMLRQRSLEPAPAVQIARGKAGEFALHAKINGVKAPMVIDTGATSVVLTWETAKAIGLPIEMLEYNVDVETAGGHTKAARLTLDRLAVGGLVEKSIPALVVPRGQMKTNLLGMSFLDRLESWGVQADKVMLHGYPDVAGRQQAPRGGELERDGFGGQNTMLSARPRQQNIENNPMQSRTGPGSQHSRRLRPGHGMVFTPRPTPPHGPRPARSHRAARRRRRPA